jgi:hypothetical protein
MDWPAVYFAFCVAGAVVGVAAAKVVSACVLPGHSDSADAPHLRLGFYLVFVALVVLPIDKWFDSKIRRLIRL